MLGLPTIVRGGPGDLGRVRAAVGAVSRSFPREDAGFLRSEGRSLLVPIP
jgi:hypothetical protein